jgi:hypothetical protein
MNKKALIVGGAAALVATILIVKSSSASTTLPHRFNVGDYLRYSSDPDGFIMKVIGLAGDNGIIHSYKVQWVYSGNISNPYFDVTYFQFSALDDTCEKVAFA